MVLNYNCKRAVAYARRWAFERNPDYFNFDYIGGNCTNFVSQCLYAGCGIMNFTPDLGWYYISLYNRAAAWTGVEYLYRFLINNKGRGPFACELPLNCAVPGDVIQMSFDGVNYTHTVIVVSTGCCPDPENILIAANTYDSLDRPINTYSYTKIRLLHIEGFRR